MSRQAGVAGDGGGERGWGGTSPFRTLQVLGRGGERSQIRQSRGSIRPRRPAKIWLCLPIGHERRSACPFSFIRSRAGPRLRHASRCQSSTLAPRKLGFQPRRLPSRLGSSYSSPLSLFGLSLPSPGAAEAKWLSRVSHPAAASASN